MILNSNYMLKLISYCNVSPRINTSGMQITDEMAVVRRFDVIDVFPADLTISFSDNSGRLNEEYISKRGSTGRIVTWCDMLGT